MTEPALPVAMANTFSYLESKGFITRRPTERSRALRRLAVEYAKSFRKNPKIVAVLLTGSSVVGNAGEWSDIDLCFVVEGRSEPIKKHDFQGVIVDHCATSSEDWKRLHCSGEGGKFLTHTVPIHDPFGFFARE
jgi:hypothetical protein